MILYCITLTEALFPFFFFFFFLELSCVNLKPYILNPKGDNNYLPSLELTKISTNIFKIKIKRISDWLEMCKRIYQNKSLLVSLQEILFHVALEALREYYLN